MKIIFLTIFQLQVLFIKYIIFGQNLYLSLLVELLIKYLSITSHSYLLQVWYYKNQAKMVKKKPKREETKKLDAFRK